MKNKISVFVIYTDNKTSTEYAKRWEVKIKNVIKNYQNNIDQFLYK
jgi:hypothetical protein